MSARIIQTMLSITVGCIWLLTLACVSSAQEMSNARSVAALPSSAVDSAPQASTAPDIRQILSEVAKQYPPGLAENAWDFNAPDGVPGFVQLPAYETSPSRLAQQ
jgi:hypothetical protein